MALTAKQEVFCQKLALGTMTQSEAYACAYDVARMTPKSLAEAASKLMRSPEVSARVEVLRERAAKAAVKRAAVTLDSCIADAEELMADAKALGQISAGVAAAKLRAQLSGHLVERKEVKQTGPLDETDVEKLVEIKAEVERKLAAAKDAAELLGEGAAATPARALRVIG